MKIIADMHTHTVASGHGYSTVNELAAAAKRKGLLAFAITDHGPALPGGPHLYHFGAMRFIPPEIEGVRVLRGVEANIINRSGDLDLPTEYQDILDFVMAGLHEGCGYDDQGKTGNTDAIINAMANPRIKAISHPGNPQFPVEYEQLVKQAIATGTALEINNASFSISRRGSQPNCEVIGRLIAEMGAPVVVGSDAHIAQNIGNFSDATALIDSVGITEKSVVNASLEQLLVFLGLPTLL